MIVRLRDEARVLDTLAAGAALPVLSCRDVVVHFGHRRALDHVDFAVDAGGLVAVLGTNGAGKSTLLRALCGLAAPNSGTVRLDGFDVTLLAPERRAALGVAHVAGAASVFDPLTVRESLVLAALARFPAAGRGPAARDLAANALAAFPALAGRAGARVATLSGGERQLLALAQAYVRQPRVLLVDELSAGLDPSAVADALTLVRRLHATGTTVVVVEQSVDVALRLAPRAVFLERGRVHFDGPSAELRGRTDLLRPVLLERMGTTGVRA